MQKSESIKEIAKALALFQSEVTDPEKSCVNTFFKNGRGEGSKYVELDDLLKATRPILSAHGLSIMQEPTASGNDVMVKTLLLHTSGEWIEFDALTLKMTKPDAQGAGSAITYGRRYALSSILGVAWDADDDGNKASQPQQKPQQQAKPPQQSQPQLMSDAQRTKLFATANENGLSADDMKAIIGYKYQVDSSKKLTTKQATELIDKMVDFWQEYIKTKVEE